MNSIVTAHREPALPETTDLDAIKVGERFTLVNSTTYFSGTVFERVGEKPLKNMVCAVMVASLETAPIPTTVWLDWMTQVRRTGPVRDRVTLVLDMSMQDAQALRALMSVIAGPTKSSPRSLTDTIAAALDGQKVEHVGARHYFSNRRSDTDPFPDCVPSPCFKNYNEIPQ